MIEILLIAVSLALDAFAVSVSSGISVPGFGWKQAVKMGLYFGVFQAAMPLIGWFLGSSLSGYITAVDHWIAFGLLALIGGRMVWGTLKDGAEEEVPADLSAGRLMMLAVATSIDALAVGVSMAFMKVDIAVAAAVIGLVAFVLSVVGGLAGRRLGNLFQQKAELVGGLVLIGIGLKILVEHLMGG
ncbi:manganese efflux pump MntP family protein [Pseudoflavonifractor phocaeensis]|uniref:manganese efflux pump MntP n=1 Tax=Pseudoflavonifractor phocaeensis TaxID=1870988 RepID=UPI0019591A35|nr:manganese efflux pump MntP family protein [Pseudoflavonifractor phocaeensis]MBM6871140.1 manganese efflux pump [Pseudoflavonifractor phocaeensis]